MTLAIKQQAFQFCGEYVHSTLEKIHLGLDNIQEALQSETKSSAGDKHETGRAMLHLEREKLGHRWAEAEKMETTLQRISIRHTEARAVLGSLVQTNTTSYFIAISAGKLETEIGPVYCISPETPIGRLLMGKTVGDTFRFRGRPSEIITIL